MSNGEPILDSDVLEGLRELQSSDDPGFVARLYETFLDHSPQQIQKMEEAITQKDGHALARLCHGMKSSCFNVGAKRTGDLCFTLEVLGEAGDMASAPQMLNQLKAEYKVAKAEIMALPEMKTSSRSP